jgi:hypothetical protein
MNAKLTFLLVMTVLLAAWVGKFVFPLSWPDGY